MQNQLCDNQPDVDMSVVHESGSILSHDISNDNCDAQDVAIQEVEEANNNERMDVVFQNLPAAHQSNVDM